jgi:uncharacterized protein (TIGR03437 family)
MTNRARVIVVSCLFSTLAAAASTVAQRTVAHDPLRFEEAGSGKLVAREGRYELALEAGRTTVTVHDRRRRTAATVTTTLAGGDTAVRPQGAEPLAAHANYLVGSDPAKWRVGAAMYGRAAYRGVYKGIDLVFHGSSGSLEYDFVAHPGANPGQIGLDIAGASALHLDSDGSLVIDTAAGDIRWKKPEVYQWKDGERQPIAGKFAVRGRRVEFALGGYDHDRDLVIDPTMTYATYLGGSDNEASRGVAVDSAGNIYVTGFTVSLDLPHTGGSLQPSYHGGTIEPDIGGDAFVAKYTAAGALSYVTYLGGKGDDVGAAIAVDASGNAYVTGFTSSSDFPTTRGAFQATYGGAGGSGQYIAGVAGPFGDAFIAKLNSTGTALTYCTYLGGSADEKASAIAVDGAGNAYVGGTTLSTNFPTSNAFQTTNKGSGGSAPFLGPGTPPYLVNGDGFVTAINPSGSALLFSTYLGGTLDDGVTAIAVDSAGNVYAGGFTLSSNFPVQGAFQTKYGGAASASAQPVISTGDGFVAKFTPAGKLSYATYLGGSGDDMVMGLAVDSQGAVYVTGPTSSSDFPGISANAAQKKLAGPTTIHNQTGFVWGDAFVAKLAPSGSTLAYATYLGGTNDDAGMAIAVDGAGDAIVGGFAMSTNLPVTSDALQKTWAGAGNSQFFTDPTGDGFIAKVSPDGSSFLYLSYYGGESSEAITALAIDGAGNVVAAGNTTSTKLPVTANAAQKAFGGQSSATPTETTGDAFVAVFSGLTSGAAAPVPVISDVENGASFQTGITANAWFTIKGSLLSSVTDTWDKSIVNGALPTKVDGVSVTVGGKPAYIYYISPTQINAVAPDVPAGTTQVIVSNSIGTSAGTSVAASIYSPAFFEWAAPSGTLYAVATRTDFTLAVKDGTFSVPTVAAKRGDVIILWGTAFGPTNPATPVGVTAPASAPTADPVTVTVGGTAAQVYTGVGYLSQGYAAVYQIAITVPNLPDGDYPVVATIKGASSPITTMLTIKGQ